MKAVAAAIFLLACATANGQMQFLQVVAPGLERELPPVFSVGAIPVGEITHVTLRVRNAGQTALVLRTVTLAGSGFTMTGEPSLPHQLAPGFNMDVTVRFSPRSFGSYSASFSVNGVSVLLTGSSTAAPTVSAAGAQISSGSVVDMGLAERGTTTSKSFRIANNSSEHMQVQRAAVTGKHFRFAQELPTPFELAPSAAYNFDITFAPTSSGVFEGALVIDGRSYRLTGASNEPPFPKPTIVLDLPSATSAQQGRVSVHFGQASRAAGPGTLRMEFRPSGAVATDDEAVRFTRGASRAATYTVAEGAVIALPDLTFQTGTTAGTIVFIAEVGGWTATASVEIAPQSVQIGKTRAIRNGSMLEIEVTGFDNTRTVDALSFTFYTSRGETVQPGAIRANSATEFRRHFDSSIAGGVFTLKAVFPVAGSIADIASAEVVMTNALGSGNSGKIQLQ